jgi:hypothetical protein
MLALQPVLTPRPSPPLPLQVGDIYTTLHCPAPFQLLYGWARAGGTPPPKAAASASGVARQSSSRATSQQREQSARNDELAAVLREAISAVAAAPAEEPTPSQQQQQQLEPQRVASAPPQLEAAQPGAFMQLLNDDGALTPAEPCGGAVMAPAPASLPPLDAAAATFAPLAFAPPAFAPQPAAAAMAFVPQQVALLPTGRYDQQLPAAGMGAMQPGAAPATAARARRGKARAAAASGSGGGTPNQAQQPGGSPAAAGEDGEEAPPTDTRKPRGLMGLLQTPADKAGTKAARPKKAAQPRKTPVAGGRAGKGGGRQKKQQAASAAAAAQQQQQWAVSPAAAQAADNEPEIEDLLSMMGITA